MNTSVPVQVPIRMTSSVGFAPTQVSGCQLWLDGADPAGTGILPANNATVSTWIDKSGNAKNFTATGTVTYTNTPSRININGSSYLENTTISNSVLTTFFVYTKTSANGPLFTTRIGDVNGFFPTEGSTTYLARSDTTWYTQTSTIPNNTLSLVAIQYDSGSNVYGWLNGVLNLQTTQTGTITRDRLRLGQRNDGTNVFYMAGSYNEVLHYDTALTTSQRQQVEGYLAWKWGLQGSLSGSQPYKNGAPFTNFLPFTQSIAPILIPQSMSSTNFRPTQISGCSLWLDAADSSTITFSSGSTISQWRDKSSNAYTGGFTVGRNFTYANNVIGKTSAVQTATGQTMIISSFAMPQTISIFHVYMPINQANGSVFIEQGTDVGVSTGFWFFSRTSEQFRVRGPSQNVAVNTATTAISNTWQLIEGINPDPAVSNLMTFYVNGQLIVSGTANTENTIITKDLYINGRNDTNLLSYPTYIGEIIVYNVALTNTQRQQVEGYLAWKWGLQSSLPSSHPWKLFPPPP